MTTLEPAKHPLPRWRDILASFDRHMATNATVAWLYAVTGPLAILLAVASRAGFAQDQVARVWGRDKLAHGGGDVAKAWQAKLNNNTVQDDRRHS